MILLTLYIFEALQMPRWTPESRQAQRELCLQIQPSKYSTGAKTESGKAVSSMNALKSGIYSKQGKMIKRLTRLSLIKSLGDPIELINLRRDFRELAKVTPYFSISMGIKP
jgi:hypothetical protein